jgi:hypothetical protein
MITTASGDVGALLTPEADGALPPGKHRPSSRCLPRRSQIAALTAEAAGIQLVVKVPFTNTVDPRLVADGPVL